MGPFITFQQVQLGKIILVNIFQCQTAKNKRLKVGYIDSMLLLRRQIQITRGFWNLGEGAVVDLDVAAVLRSPNLRIWMIDSKMFKVVKCSRCKSFALSTASLWSWSFVYILKIRRDRNVKISFSFRLLIRFKTAVESLEIFHLCLQMDW